MKYFFFSLVLLLTVILSVFYLWLLPETKNTLESTLLRLGFSHVDIPHINPTLTGLNIPVIMMDQEGFSKAENIRMVFYWPRFLFEKKPDHVDIASVTILTTDTKILDLLKLMAAPGILKKNEIPSLPSRGFTLQKLVWQTVIGQSMIEVNGSVNGEHSNDRHIITMDLNSDQENFTGLAQIKIALMADQSLSLHGTFENTTIRTPAFSLYRMNGWMNWEDKDNQSLTMQMNAGSGEVLQTPFQAFDLIIGTQGKMTDLILRANFPPAEGNHFALDATFENFQKIKSGQFLFALENSREFLTLAPFLSRHIEDKNILFPPNDLSIAMAYMPEKRFAAGPYPFDLHIKDQGAELMNGNILLYPESYDLRGSMTGQKNFIGALSRLFSIKDDYAGTDYIRIEANLEGLLGFEGKGSI